MKKFLDPYFLFQNEQYTISRNCPFKGTVLHETLHGLRIFPLLRSIAIIFLYRISFSQIRPDI